MWKDYFELNGNKYYSGTVLIINLMWRPNTKAIFVCYDFRFSSYVVRVDGIDHNLSEQEFYRRIVKITDERNEHVHMPVVKQKHEYEIDGMFTGWVCYVALLAASLIFKDFILLWALVSAVFFTWRAKKIEKEGSYIEW